MAEMDNIKQKKETIGWKHLYRQLSADNDTKADNGWFMAVRFAEEYRTPQSRQEICAFRNKKAFTNINSNRFGAHVEM